MPGLARPSTSEYAELESTLLNTSGNVSLALRFRALFTLRNIKTHTAIDIIGKGFQDPSALLGHELAYVLGQINDAHALPILESVLRNELQHPMVRHEAAEAMGAISSLSSLPILEEHFRKPGEDISVVETCEIAIAKIQYDHSLLSEPSPASFSSPSSSQQRSIYDSIDPAPPISMHDTEIGSSTNIQSLREHLLDSSRTLFERYRAMFALRNNGSKEAVLALADGFADSSALFRHEIAYIFGQLSSPYSVPSLLVVLQNESEADMVRHEAAEALGSIATDDVLPALRSYAQKGPRVVRESCEVALDMYEYEKSGQLDYADSTGSRSTLLPSATSVAATA